MRWLLLLAIWLVLPELPVDLAQTADPAPRRPSSSDQVLVGRHPGSYQGHRLHAQPRNRELDLAKWEREGNSAAIQFSNEGIRLLPEGCTESWLRSAQPYENFRLRFLFRLDRWAETGIALRAPVAGRPLQSGIGIMLAHDFHRRIGERVTGAIAGVKAPTTLLPERYGEWQMAEVLLVDDQLQVSIDGVQTQNLNLSAHSALAGKPSSGHLGFVNLCHGATFRDIEIEALPGASDIIRFAPDHDLRDWAPRGSGRFRAEPWGLVADGGDGILYLPGVYRDFEFGAVLRTTDHVNSGIFLRGSASPDERRGIEVQIYSPPDAVFPTGSIYGHQRSDLDVDYEGQWIALRIRLEGSECRVWVNGKQVAASETIPETGLAEGRIGLQIHSRGQVAFRDLWVRPLGGTPDSAHPGGQM